MKITDKLTKQITETKYLTVDNSWRYRVIIEGYTLEQCTLDLDIEKFTKHFKSKIERARTIMLDKGDTKSFYATIKETSVSFTMSDTLVFYFFCPNK